MSTDPMMLKGGETVKYRIVDNDYGQAVKKETTKKGELDLNDVIVIEKGGQEERVRVDQFLASSYDSSLSPQERLRIVLDTAGRVGGGFAESASRFARVLKVL